jgi:hypothetical protein
MKSMYKYHKANELAKTMSIKTGQDPSRRVKPEKKSFHGIIQMANITKLAGQQRHTGSLGNPPVPGAVLPSRVSAALAENAGRTEIFQAFPSMPRATAERGARSATLWGRAGSPAPKKRARSDAPCPVV